MCPYVVLFELILFRTLCFLDPDVCFLSQLVMFSGITTSNVLSAPFFLLFFWDPYNVSISMLNVISMVF